MIPNRDKKHGRIWKITYSGNDQLRPENLTEMSTEALLTKGLTTYEDRARYRARRELGAREKEAVIAAVDKVALSIAGDSEAEEHHLLELLWVKQHHDAYDAELLDQLLAAQDARARAAAVRVLCYWRDGVEDPLAKLQAAIHDEHPRVRLEAVRALSFFDNQQALDIAVESLIYDQDVYLEYTLKETMETLQNRIDRGAKAVSSSAN